MNQIWLALLTGLTSGGISCVAVQGGLLSSSLTEEGEAVQKGAEKTKKVVAFLLAKLISYTLLGVLLGFFGSFLILSVKTQAVIQLLIGIYLMGTVGKMLNLHPIFRYFSLKPPKRVYILAKRLGKNPNLLTPSFLGFLTVFMPCGVTQAMMVIALSTGNPLLGAGVMGAFTIGTSPVFFTLGVATGELLKRRSFSYVASLFILYFGLLSISGAMGLMGSPHTLQNYKIALKSLITGEDLSASPKVAGISKTGVQEITIYVSNTGYSPNVNTLVVGVPVRLNLVTNKTYGCSRAFTIPSLGISRVLPETGSAVITFTPTKKGRLAYSCAMGMYTGWFEVI